MSEVNALVRAALADAERARRSARANVLVTFCALVLAASPLLPGADLIFSQVGWQGPVVVGCGWLVFEFACLAFHRAGPEGALYRFASALDTIGQPATILGLAFFSDGFSAGQFILLVAPAFAWFPEDPSRTRRALWLRAIAHVAVACAFLGKGLLVQSIMTMLVYVATAIVNAVTTETQAHALRMSVERDLFARMFGARQVNRERERIARELHDGIGADVTAMLLRFRRTSTSTDLAKVDRSAQRILSDLRNVVWTLRNERATLGDMRKLIHTRCRNRSHAVVRTSVAPEHAEQNVGPEEALAALEAALELVEAAGEEVRAIDIELSHAAELCLLVRINGGPAQRVDTSAGGAEPRP